MKAILLKNYHRLKKWDELAFGNNRQIKGIFGNPNGNDWFTDEFVYNHPELFKVEK